MASKAKAKAKVKVGRQESVPDDVAMATRDAVSAFGDDLADDTYSVSELSHVDDEARSVKGQRVKVQGQGQGQGQLGACAAQAEITHDAFLRTTISRAKAGSLASYPEEGQSSTTSGSSSPPSSSGGHKHSPQHTTTTTTTITTSNSNDNNSSNRAGGGSDDGDGDGDASGGQDKSQDGSGSDVTAPGSGGGSDVSDLDSPSAQSSFAHFAKTRFHLKGATHAYCCSALQHPLLAQEDRGDFLASLAVWVLILRIMGDLPDQDNSDVLLLAGEQPPVITVVKASYKTKHSKKDVEDAQAKYSELFKEPLATDVRCVPFLPERCDSMLDKVQYVVALGIYRPQLRDEILCQICKQLTNNPSRNSTVRGWVLLSLVAGSFSPSERFALCFREFLREGPPEFAEKADRLARRTCTVGTRGYPPSWLEFQASKNNKPLLVPVTFMNGYRTLCEVDSATTVQELVHNIAEKIGLKDPIGFSIYVTLHTKISCLGHGNHRVMDAISECEQHTRMMGLRESSALWRLYFRREYFPPWVSSQRDPVNMDLIYEQICRGVALGEYRCEKEEVLIMMVAQKFYIEHSDDTALVKLDHFVRNWMTQELKDKYEPAHFVQRVRECVQNNFAQSKPDTDTLKRDIVMFARDKWYLQFSRFYDSPKVQGPGLPLVKVVVAVNSRGLYILDDADTIRMHVTFWEMTSVTRSRSAATVRTLKGEEFVIHTSHSEDLYLTLTSFIDELRTRTRFAVVTQDITHKEGGPSVTIPRGELFSLSKPFSDASNDVTVQGVCKSASGTAVSVPRDRIYPLAISSKPTADVANAVLAQVRKDPTRLCRENEEKSRTLQQFSRLHFRPVSESTVSKLLNKASFKRDKGEALWQWSRDPLKKPLLRRTCLRGGELLGPSCRSFVAIQQYMGDAAVTHQLKEVELATGYILDPARRNKYLRDEIFCQLIKQLTNNPDKGSETKGWNLMTLLCATATPSGDMLDQCLSFLKAAKNRQAGACADHLNAQKTSGSRLFSPHATEHEMVTSQQTSVHVKIMLPSGTAVTLEAGCRTRVSDLKREMRMRLRLHSVAEYSLFLSSSNSMHCLPDRAFYFDCLSHAELHWVKPNTETETGPWVPSLVMLKKIWVNVNPGDNPEADKHFHFPQEVPNFVRGYHQCSRQEVVELSALLFRSRFGKDESPFKKFSEVAHTLLPRGFIDTSTSEEIKKEIEAEYRKSDGLSQDEARLRFLRVAVTWPTYGSVFFEVKQRTVKTLPKYCLVAINTRGLHISDIETKELKKTYEFSQIPNWAYDDNSFTIIINNHGNNHSRLLLETFVGHNMDDVLMSHIAWVMETQMKRKHGFYNNVGESFC